MPNAMEVRLADAVVAELNDSDRGWSTSFTAVRSWRPVWQDDELSTLRVSVVPITLDVSRLSRSPHDKMEYGLAIDFQQRIATTTTTAADALAKLAEEVHQFFRDAHHLNTMNGFEVLNAQRADIYDLTRLHAEGVWETLIVLTVTGFGISTAEGILLWEAGSGLLHDSDSYINV